MQRLRSSAYRLFRAAACGEPLPVEAAEPAHTRKKSPAPQSRSGDLTALPPLEPYKRCTCGACRECRDNERWDRVFAKFEVKETEVRGLYGCALVDL
jgi:hypothetical protein